MEEISVEELKRLMSEKVKFLLLDVRDRHELLNGILPGSRNLPLPEFETAFSMPKELFFKRYGFSVPKDGLIVVYCRTGKRSQRAAEFLENLGFVVKNFSGSILEWSKQDKNVKMY